MDIVMKPVEMIAWFSKDGTPNPIRYRFEERGDNLVVKVDRVISIDEENLAGNRMYVYRCKSHLNNRLRVYELKYEITSCRWFLSRINT